MQSANARNKQMISVIKAFQAQLNKPLVSHRFWITVLRFLLVGAVLTDVTSDLTSCGVGTRPLIQAELPSVSGK
jgi:hypothetical protein